MVLYSSSGLLRKISGWFYEVAIGRRKGSMGLASYRGGESYS